MTKKHFIELADRIRLFNQQYKYIFNRDQLLELADFCQSMNPRFNRNRWLDYIDGKCGPSGGTVRR